MPRRSYREAFERLCAQRGLDPKSRARPVSYLRHAAFALAALRGGNPSEIAHWFGMNHSTVRHGVRRFCRGLENPDTRGEEYDRFIAVAREVHG